MNPFVRERYFPHNSEAHSKPPPCNAPTRAKPSLCMDKQINSRDLPPLLQDHMDAFQFPSNNRGVRQ